MTVRAWAETNECAGIDGAELGGLNLLRNVLQNLC